jgi:hypothetical protein
VEPRHHVLADIERRGQHSVVGIDVGTELWIAIAADPVTQENIATTGELSTAPCSLADTDHLIPFAPNPKNSGRWSVYSSFITSTYASEWDCEVARRSTAPELPSRFGCLYLFSSERDASAARSRHNRQSRIRRVRVSELRAVHTADIELVSMIRRLYMTQAPWTPDDLQREWQRYWRGEPARAIELPVWVGGGEPLVQSRRIDPQAPIWEVLLDGSVEMVDQPGK